MGKTTLIAAAIVCLAALTVQAGSTVVTFTRITNNNDENVEAQLTLQIVDDVGNPFSGDTGSLDTDEVLFLFRNNVGVASSISEIYLDDGTILLQSTIFNNLDGDAGDTMNFTGPGANPGNLPSGQNVIPPFVATVAFSADAVGNTNRGVDEASDVLGIVYQLQAMMDFSDVEDAIADGSLRFGLHLRGIGREGDSDSFVNNRNGTPPEFIIPEPGTIALLGFGLIGLGVGAWKRRRRAA